MALAAGHDPNKVSMDDGLLLTRALVATGRMPDIDAFYGRRPAEDRLGFRITRQGKRRISSWASSAEQFDAMVAAGLATRRDAA